LEDGLALVLGFRGMSSGLAATLHSAPVLELSG